MISTLDNPINGRLPNRSAARPVIRDVIAAITQEEADEMQARRAMASYLDRDALVAAALGMTVEELEAAYAEGATRSTLAAEKGLDEAAFQAALEQAKFAHGAWTLRR